MGKNDTGNVDKTVDNRGFLLGKTSSSGSKFLVRRSDSDIWAYHRHLPADIFMHVVGEVRLYWNGKMARLTGKKAVAISLGTSDKREAMRRRDQVHVAVEILVDQAMRIARPIGLSSEPKLLGRLTEDQKRQLGEAVFSETLVDIDRPTILGSGDADDATIEAMIADHVAEVAAEGTEREAVDRFLERDFDRFLARFNVEMVEKTARREAALAIVRARRKAAKAIQAKEQGDVIDVAPVAFPFSTGTNDERRKGSGPLIRETFEKFVTAREMKKNTADDYRNQINRFSEMFGDIPIENVTRKMIFEFAFALEDFPSRYPESWRGRKFPEIMKLAAKHPELPRLATQTINDRCIGALRSFFGWCVRRQLLDENPATGVVIDMKKTAQKPRLPYTIDHLKLIFSQPVFSAGERPLAGAGEASFWIPMIALHSGMRLEEIGQLRVSDIKIQDGIWFFDLVAVQGETSLKNANSARRVPMHHFLIEKGLLEERDRLAKAGETRLFPKIKSAEGRPQTAAFSKWWGRWTSAIGLDDPSLVFHSFRHSFKDRCRDCKIPMPISEALMGHSSGSKVADQYGLGFSLSELADNMQKIDWSPVFTGNE